LAFRPSCYKGQCKRIGKYGIKDTEYKIMIKEYKENNCLEDLTANGEKIKFQRILMRYDGQARLIRFTKYTGEGLF
jgi:hypothetical protein